ncbi:MAG: hypothetical protein JHC61_01005 [Burkholderiaceae bacterium]|nr:hypothetical protein [Burkholderiaceae bacterium]
MRRAVTLFLLFLLPLEVFAGIAYELKIAHEASQGIELSAADTAADADLLLDLGETFDLPCAFTKKSPSLITSPPGHFTYCDKSIVTAVPIPPAI